MTTLWRHLSNLVAIVAPVYRWYGLRRGLLRLAGIDVAADAKVNGHVWFYGRGSVRVGRGSWVGPGCRFYTAPGAQITVGARCDVGPEVSFITGSHETGSAARRAGPERVDPITIGEGCWIGARVTLLGGCEIGSSSVIAAGSVVRGHIPPDSLAAGVPAVVKKGSPSPAE